ncbi:hypothetical protein BD289DRAFT_427673 [Coniella lustricola]|uniref:Uncharacterized protein n=1 Tax=Coniella lustricola TaxID=2025994 RepID=A0A2T3AEX7_9PEZI|nr:hypothetical protein BD289DRAFT_427673 [Coniella lustricola]
MESSLDQRATRPSAHQTIHFIQSFISPKTRGVDSCQAGESPEDPEPQHDHRATQSPTGYWSTACLGNPLCNPAHRVRAYLGGAQILVVANLRLDLHTQSTCWFATGRVYRTLPSNLFLPTRLAWLSSLCALCCSEARVMSLLDDNKLTS